MNLRHSDQEARTRPSGSKDGSNEGEVYDEWGGGGELTETKLKLMQSVTRYKDKTSF